MSIRAVALTLLLSLAGAALRAAATPITAGASDALVDSIGLNIHSTHYLGFSTTAYDDWPSVISAVGNLGIRHVRDHVFDPSRLNQLTAATGAKVTAIVEQHTFVGGVLMLDQTSVPTVLNDARQVTGLEALEGPSEYNEYPDPNWRANLRTYQATLYAAARGNAAFSSVPVIGPSITNRAEYAGFSDLGVYSDRGNVHSYPGASVPTAGLTDWLTASTAMVGAGKSTWSTETGYHAHVSLTTNPYDVSQAAFAKYIPRLVMDYYRMGVERSFLYELVDDNADPQDANAENNLGLYKTDFTLKPAGAALKNLISLLSDPGAGFTPSSLDYTLTGGNPNLRQVLLQKRDGTFWLALWQDVSVFDKSTNTDLTNADLPVTLNFGSGINGAAVYLPDGSTAPVAIFGATSQLSLAVPDQVMLVQISVPEPAGALAIFGSIALVFRRRVNRRSR